MVTTNSKLSIPSALNAGDTWLWTENLSDYPASDGWTLNFHLVAKQLTADKNSYNGTPSSRGSQVIDLQSTTVDGQYQFSKTPVQTALFRGGTYEWVAYVAKYTTVPEVLADPDADPPVLHQAAYDFINEQYTVCVGSIRINENPLTTSTFDTRNKYQVIVEQIDQAMSDFANQNGITEYTIDGHTIRKGDLSKMIELRKHYAGLASRMKYGSAPIRVRL